MKKISLLFFSFFLLWAFTNIALAQNRTSSENYQELLGNYRAYQSLVEPLNVKKSRQATLQTVSSQAELLEASKNLLQGEIKAITSYSAFIKSLLAEATQVLNYRDSYLYLRLDDELAYLKQAGEKASLLSSLAEVNQFSAELKSHYQKLKVMGYQIKSIIYLESAKKVFENLKTGKDKLNNFFSENKESGSRILAAKEKFSDLNKEISASQDLLSRAESSLKEFEAGDPKKTAEKIKGLVDQALLKINIILTGYKNIAYSLK